MGVYIIIADAKKTTSITAPHMHYSNRRFFPLGGGARSIRGVYVTVRVTVCRTLTGRKVPPVLAASRDQRLASRSHSNGDRIVKGDRIENALVGESLVPGEHIGDEDIRSRRSGPVVGADRE